jgi:hypothetical protein
MLTIFSIPKPFRGHIGVIQRNAIRSWLRLEPRPEVILLGDEEGTAHTAQMMGVQHIPNVVTNDHGTPLLNDALRRAQDIAQTPLLCLVNGDIVLLQEFAESVAQVARQLSEFLIVAQRWNIDAEEELDFSPSGGRRLREEILPRGEPGSHTAIDVFVFPVNLYESVPDLALGRAWFDQWLIKEARRNGVAVVDVTPCARAIHQNHEYGHIAGGQKGAYWGEEAQRNLTIYDEEPHAYTLVSATHELSAGGKVRRVRLRKMAFAARNVIWEVFVHRTRDLREMLGLKRRVWGRKGASSSR